MLARPIATSPNVFVFSFIYISSLVFFVLVGSPVHGSLIEPLGQPSALAQQPRPHLHAKWTA